MENNGILKHFETLPDHRQNGKILHPMRNIVFIVLVGAFNRLDGWEEIADFAEYRREFFEKCLDLTNGILSDDTLRRFLEALDSNAFRTHFTEWASSIVPKTEDKTVCIDGKRIRTASRMSDDPIHIVSAWVAECVRKHWGIESMHWKLDVIFDEDSCLKRMRNSAENFDIVIKIAS